MTLLKLSIPLGNEILTTVRLATGGVCSLAGLDIDRSEDCKLCITESLLLLLHAGYSAARVEFSREEGLLVRVEGEGMGTGKEGAETEISEALLGALAGSVSFERKDGVLTAVMLTF